MYSNAVSTSNKLSKRFISTFLSQYTVPTSRFMPGKADIDARVLSGLPSLPEDASGIPDMSKRKTPGVLLSGHSTNQLVGWYIKETPGIRFISMPGIPDISLTVSALPGNARAYRRGPDNGFVARACGASADISSWLAMGS